MHHHSINSVRSAGVHKKTKVRSAGVQILTAQENLMQDDHGQVGQADKRTDWHQVFSTSLTEPLKSKATRKMARTAAWFLSRGDPVLWPGWSQVRLLLLISMSNLAVSPLISQERSSYWCSNFKRCSAENDAPALATSLQAFAKSLGCHQTAMEL